MKKLIGGLLAISVALIGSVALAVAPPTDMNASFGWSIDGGWADTLTNYAHGGYYDDTNSSYLPTNETAPNIVHAKAKLQMEVVQVCGIAFTKIQEGKNILDTAPTFTMDYVPGLNNASNPSKSNILSFVAGANFNYMVKGEVVKNPDTIDPGDGTFSVKLGTGGDTILGSAIDGDTFVDLNTPAGQDAAEDIALNLPHNLNSTVQVFFESDKLLKTSIIQNPTGTKFTGGEVVLTLTPQP